MAMKFQYPLMDRLGWKFVRMDLRRQDDGFQYPLMDRLGWKLDADRGGAVGRRFSIL